MYYINENLGDIISPFARKIVNIYKIITFSNQIDMAANHRIYGLRGFVKVSRMSIKTVNKRTDSVTCDLKAIGTTRLIRGCFMVNTKNSINYLIKNNCINAIISRTKVSSLLEKLN